MIGCEQRMHARQKEFIVALVQKVVGRQFQSAGYLQKPDLLPHVNDEDASVPRDMMANDLTGGKQREGAFEDGIPDSSERVSAQCENTRGCGNEVGTDAVHGQLPQQRSTGGVTQDIGGLFRIILAAGIIPATDIDPITKNHWRR